MAYAIKIKKVSKWHFLGQYSEIQKYESKEQANAVAKEYKKYSAKVVDYPNVVMRTSLQ